MFMKEYPLDAEWTDDCQGKYDYDGKVLGISTRYWPSNYQSNSKCSAKSSLLLYYKEDLEKETYDPGYINLLEKEFEADTEAEVKRQVEEWAQEQMNNIVTLLRTSFLTSLP